MMTQQRTISVPLPCPLGDDFVAGEETAGLVGPPHVIFYKEAIKLYHLLGRIVTEVYNPWSARADDAAKSIAAGNDEVGSILDMSEELGECEENTAPILHWQRGQHLRDALPEAVRATVQRQANVLHARFVGPLHHFHSV